MDTLLFVSTAVICSLSLPLPACTTLHTDHGSTDNHHWNDSHTGLNHVERQYREYKLSKTLEKFDKFRNIKNKVTAAAKLKNSILLKSPAIAPDKDKFGDWRGDKGSARGLSVHNRRQGRWHKHRLTYVLLNFAPTLSRSQQRRAFARAFSHWSDVTPLVFTEVHDVTADIRIQFVHGYHLETYYGHPCPEPFDGPHKSSRTWSGNKFAHAFAPPAGEIHFDGEEEWTIGSEDGISLELVAAHEIGHALGLQHSRVRGSLMLSFFTGNDPHFSLSADDVYNIQALYGSNPYSRYSQSSLFNVIPNTPSRNHPHNAPAQVLTTHSYPDLCTTRFDALFQGPDNYVYVFKHKWIWKLDKTGVVGGSPPLIQMVYKHAPPHVTAAVYSPRTRFTYIFYRNHVLQYRGHRLYRRRFMSTEDYGNPNAAFAGFTGKIYILRGRFYWIFDERRLAVTTPYKRRISDTWRGVPNHVTSAMTVDEYHVHFFVGHTYWVYDMIHKRTSDESPLDQSLSWMGVTCVEARSNAINTP